jgi:hypothetical protein
MLVLRKIINVWLHAYAQADICQLGMDQRKVNVLAREYCDKIKRKLKPVILSHEMLPGLLEVHGCHFVDLMRMQPASTTISQNQDIDEHEHLQN